MGNIGKMANTFFALPQGSTRRKKSEKGKLAKMANGGLLLGKKVLAYMVEKVEKVQKRLKR